MRVIRREDLAEECWKGDVTLREACDVASYNWLGSRAPTIVVPGCPALWKGFRRSQKVPKDSGCIVSAHNAYLLPESPLEPLFRSVLIMQPLFDLNRIRVVCDRTILRRLLRFIDPLSSSYPMIPFTIDIEAVHSTLLLQQVEMPTHQFVGPREFVGFGHQFEKIFTEQVIRDSVVHHKVAHYKFGNIEMLMRYEVDGFIGKRPLRRFKMLEDRSAGASRLKVMRGGAVTERSATLELKTRTARQVIGMEDVGSQLWLSSTSKIVRAYHTGGLFAPCGVEDVTHEIQKWQQDNDGHLRRLMHLLEVIISECGSGGQSTLRYETTNDAITITPKEAGCQPFLPRDLYEKWKS